MALSSTITIFVIGGIFLVVAFVAFIVTFLCCVFCPFCIIPTMKKRRQEQVPTNTRSNHNRREESNVMIEVQNANNLQTAAQPAMLQHEQRISRAPAHECSNSIPLATFNIPNDPPPPYPGLQGQSGVTNLQYNPYFSEDNNSSVNPTAPSPSPIPNRK